MIKTGEYGQFSLEHAEVGDRLMVGSGSRDPNYDPVTITGLTKTRITTSDNRQWMRASAKLVGADKWCLTYLYAYDEATIHEVEQKKRRGNLIRKIMGIDFKSLELGALERIAATVDAETGKLVAEGESKAA